MGWLPLSTIQFSGCESDVHALHVTEGLPTMRNRQMSDAAYASRILACFHPGPAAAT